MESQEKKCQACQRIFLIDSEDFQFYERIKVPAPTWCPECREIRRLVWRNERALYKRKCDLCGKKVVGRVSPDKRYPMYCNSCWWGDDWDPMEYGRDYDLSKPFFEQFQELLNLVPHPALGAANNVNSDWVNQETDDKNCYLNVGGHFNEDSAYNTYELYGKDCFDNLWVLSSELCYECVNCERCYKTLFSQDCFDCRNTYFSSDCRNCSNIFGCTGLRSKQYHIFNRPYKKEEYLKFISENTFSSDKKMGKLKENSEKIRFSVPHRYSTVLKSVNVSGNYINESKNAHNIWNAKEIEDSKNLYISAGMKDSYDGSSIGWGELCYEGAHTVGVYEGKFFVFSFSGKAEARQSSNLEYCAFAGTSSNCFGCVSIRNKEYCILNKQYSKEEYEKLVSRIKEEMIKNSYKGKNGRIYGYGEFFPTEMSPYGYNETAAMDYYPLGREEALDRGFSWSDYEPETKHQFSDYKIPEEIGDVRDDILDKVLKCEVSGKPYRIIPMELQFYRRMGLPIPRYSPLQRHKERMKRFLPRKLFDRTCQCAGKWSENGIYRNTTSHFHKEDHCSERIKTPYGPEREEIVYCEECYQAEIL